MTKIDIGIEKRGSAYRFTVYCGYDVNGKQIRKTTTWKPPEGLTERKSDKLAKEEYINFKNKCNGIGSLKENMRFKDLVEEYFKIYAPNNLKPVTLYNYRKMVDFRLMDYFGNKKLKEINTSMLSSFFCSMTKVNPEGITEPVEPSTAKKVFTVMQSLMHFAMKQKYITVNPCVDVVLPKKKPTIESGRKFMTEEELPRFLELLKPEVLENVLDRIIMVLLYTGMRSGELLGLSWSDVDFQKKQIKVTHTLSEIGGNKFLTTPKTKTSRRTIALGQNVIELLQIQKKYQMMLQDLSPNFIHPEMVFTTHDGQFKDRSHLNTQLRSFLKDTEFDFLTLHCLRHTNATLLLNAGVDLKIVSEHLGHSDISTTANIYVDILESSRRKTAEIIDLKLAK